MTMKPYDAVLPTPILKVGDRDFSFAIGIRCDGDEVTELHYLPAQAEVSPTKPLAHEAVRQLRAYFADPEFEFGLPLAAVGTHFQRRVWGQIASIPAGATQSYGEVASAIRSGPRAVGNACGANPYPLAVPCHRVLAANQKIGGFGKTNAEFYLDIKRALLQHERR
jgi:methylated-DNA-[protein]-cysteine S-methyltransferase